MPNTKDTEHSLLKRTTRYNGILTDALRRASEKVKQEKEKKESARQQIIKKPSNKN